MSAPEFFRASCGRRRMFPSEASALAYEQGWSRFPLQPDGPAPSPEWTGYHDAEQYLALDNLPDAEERRAMEWRPE